MAGSRVGASSSARVRSWRRRGRGVEVAVRVDEMVGRKVAEVVSADSMLIYRRLDIGAAKPTVEERRGVTHHLIDVVEPMERFTVHDWLRLARERIAEIQGRG